MRFLHTADWQIGMKAAHVGAAGEHIREQRLKTARRVIVEARKARAEFILIAGDTFENNAVDRLLIQKTADILAGAGMPVYLIPGNHDPYVPGSVWEHPAWGSSRNVRILTENAPVEIPGGILFPCPIREKFSRKDPTRWIQPGTEGEIRIGAAHGTVEGVRQDEPDHPIPRNAAERAGLDYLALGHWHSTARYPGTDGAVRMAYSGTPEPTAFGERDSGNVLIVEIERPGAVPAIETVHTGGLEWREIPREVRTGGDLAALRREIEGIENPAAVLLSLSVSGLMAPEDRAELDRIREIVASRFLYGRMDASRLRPSPADDRWIATLPAGIIRQAGEKLRRLADPAFAGPRPEGVTAEAASRALMELYALMAQTEEARR